MTSEDPSTVVVTFGHGARHLAGTGLLAAEVESSIRSDVRDHLPPVKDPMKRIVRVRAITIEYRAYRIDERWVHVGTYFPI